MVNVDTVLDNSFHLCPKNKMLFRMAPLLHFCKLKHVTQPYKLQSQAEFGSDDNAFLHAPGIKDRAFAPIFVSAAR